MNEAYAILIYLIGFVLAQAWKFFQGIKGQRGALKKKSFAEIIGYASRSGGMPSGHVASMTGAAFYLGLTAGFNSGVFALAAVTTMMAFYDAIHVRFAVGEQGKVLNKMLEQEGQKPLAVVEGHTMKEAIAGMALGIVVGGIGFLVFAGI